MTRTAVCAQVLGCLLVDGSGEPTRREDDRVFAVAMVQEAVLLTCSRLV